MHLRSEQENAMSVISIGLLVRVNKGEKMIFLLKSLCSSFFLFSA